MRLYRRLLTAEVDLLLNQEYIAVTKVISNEDKLRIRDKSNLPEKIKREIRGEPFTFHRRRHFEREFVQKYYAKYGEASLIKPGVCWGSVEEMKFKQKFEDTFYPSLKTLMDMERDEQKRAAREVSESRALIKKNLAQLPKAMEEFYKKLKQKEIDEKAERMKKEKLIQEVREYLGYDLAPGDTRFQEALRKKEEEEKLEAKKSKKQEKLNKVMARLAAMAEEDTTSTGEKS